MQESKAPEFPTPIFEVQQADSRESISDSQEAISESQESDIASQELAQPGAPSRFAPARYGILVSGVLPASWAPFFHNLEICEYEPAGECPITCLTGELPDQAALVGVITRL